MKHQTKPFKLLHSSNFFKSVYFMSLILPPSLQTSHKTSQYIITCSFSSVLIPYSISSHLCRSCASILASRGENDSKPRTVSLISVLRRSASVLDIKWPTDYKCVPQNISHHNSLSSCICIEVLGFRFNATDMIDERCICLVGNKTCLRWIDGLKSWFSFWNEILYDYLG